MKDRILIKNALLTPTMERVRNGRVQMFREKDANDRTFIDITNADLILSHDRPEMFAMLINDQWFWVNGCAQCNEEHDVSYINKSSYVTCDQHNRCNSCKIQRKDIKEKSVWGQRTGWLCDTCQKAKELETMRAAFEKLAGEAPDTYCTTSPICPHCGSEDYDYYHENEPELECTVCHGEFSLEVEHTPSYSTKIIGKRITLEEDT